MTSTSYLQGDTNENWHCTISEGEMPPCFDIALKWRSGVLAAVRIARASSHSVQPVQHMRHRATGNLFNKIIVLVI